MRPSPWDIIAPGYWTPEQESALEETLRARRLSFDALRQKERRTKRRRRMWWIVVLLLVVFWLASRLTKLDEAMWSWLPDWTTRPWGIAGVFTMWAAYFFAAGVFVLMRNKAGPRARLRQARSLRIFLPRAAVRKPSPRRDRLVADDLRARRNLWSKRLSGGLVSAKSADQSTSVTAVLSFGSGFLLLLAGFYDSVRDHLDVVIPGFAVVLIGVYWAGGQKPVRRMRLHLAVKSFLCPSCQYDLQDASPAIAPERLDGEFIGPEHCPECGSLWPLLPPPLSPTGCPTSLDRGRDEIDAGRGLPVPAEPAIHLP